MSRNWVAMLAKEDGWPWAGLPPSSSLAVPDASWSVQLSLSYNCEPKGGAVPTLLIYGGRAHGIQRLVLDPQAEELPRESRHHLRHWPGLRRRMGLAGRLHTLFNCLCPPDPRDTHTLLNCPDPRDSLLRVSVQGTQQLQRATVSLHVPQTTSPRGAERGKKDLIKSRVSVPSQSPMERYA